MDRKPKTLLIYPPITTGPLDSPASVCWPIGLAYLAAVLEKNSYPVIILDAVAEGGMYKNDTGIRAGMADEEIRDFILQFNPDIIGISAMFTAYARDAHQIASIAKKINPNILVLFGGAHASCNYDMVLRDNNVDYIIKGEGEETLLEIIRAYESNSDVSSVSGLIFKKDGQIKFSQNRDYIQNLDTIPFPARHLLKIDKYLKLKSPYCLRNPLGVVISSRGCPKHCIYCSIHSVWGERWRGRSAKNVIDEIEMLYREYGIKEVHFNDDNISADKARIHQICDEMITRKIDIKWTTPNGIALWTLDRPLIKKMKQAGCYRLTFGIETGNPEMQKYIGKNLNLDYAKQVISWANKEGLWTICTHIIGFPCETTQEINDTVNFAIKSGTDFALFYNLTPFRGTQLYHIFESENLVPSGIDEGDDFFVAEFACDTKNLTKDEIRVLQGQAYRKFMLKRIVKFLINPFCIARKIYSLETFFYAFRLFKTFINININLVKFKEMGAKVLYGKR